jgi:pimeloyl-ACP methyl ester carboxylesterase
MTNSDTDSALLIQSETEIDTASASASASDSGIDIRADTPPAKKRTRSEPPASRKHAARATRKAHTDGRNGELPFAFHVFATFAIAYSPSFSFCWRLIGVSFYAIYLYSKFFARFLAKEPRHGIYVISYAAKALLYFTGLVGLSAWCISITPIHVLAPTLMDFWSPYAVHPTLQGTQVMYDAGENAEVDIFAIHGLGSNPDSAWAYRVVLVNHQTRWDANSADMGLYEHASDLLNHIENLRKHNPSRPIIFIAHSFGGILLKKALLVARYRSRDIAAATEGIIFLGVPHQGTNAAFAASCLSCMAFFRGSSSSLLELLSVDGPKLLDLESDFYDSWVIQDSFHPRQPYVSDILEKRPEKIGKLVLGSIVRPRNGQLRHGRLFAMDTDHRGLNKFQSHDDPNYQIFLRVLRQAYEHAVPTQTSTLPSG